MTAEPSAEEDLLACIITELKEEEVQEDPLEMALDLTFSAPPPQTSFEPTSTPALVMKVQQWPKVPQDTCRHQK